jgi:anthranilate phosphoribosyltransferase
MCEVIAAVLAGRGCSALVFHGSDGLDELTTTTTSRVWVVQPGERVQISEAVLDPADLGIARAKPRDLEGGDVAYNADVVHAVLRGDHGPVRDTVLLNAAAALAADAGVPGAAALTASLSDGYKRAAAAVDSGAAAALLTRWVETTRRLATTA